MSKMTLTLGKDRAVWKVATKGGLSKAIMPAGVQEVEVIPDPQDPQRGPWLVRKGTNHGAPLSWWEYLRDMANSLDQTQTVIISM